MPTIVQSTAHAGASPGACRLSPSVLGGQVSAHATDAVTDAVTDVRNNHTRIRVAHLDSISNDVCLVLFASGGAKAAVLSETFARASFQAGLVVSRDRGGKRLVAAQVSGPAQIIQHTMWHTVLSADEGAAKLFQGGCTEAVGGGVFEELINREPIRWSSDLGFF